MKYELDQIDESIVTLDTYNSDLNLVIDGSKYSAQPLTKEGFAFMWAGARASHGSDKGKFCFEMKVVEHLDVSHLPADEPNPHVVRIGFSVDSTSLQLGEDPLSYGYGGTGKISTNCQFKDFGPPFVAGDTILAVANMDSDPVQIGFAKNGNFLGWAYKVKKSDLRGKALFPHVLTKNCSFEVNLGQKDEPYFKLPDTVKDFIFIGCLPADKRVGGTRPPAKREDCEMIMMCGLPGAGKSVWAADYSSKNPEKKYNILGTNNIIDKMKVMGLPRKRNYAGRWDVLIQMATKCLNTMFAIGSKLRRNYVLDQTNVYPTAQRRKMRNFDGFKRKAVVIVPTEVEYKRRCDKRDREEGKEVPDSAVLEMKANFKIPEVNDIFDEVIFTEIQRDEAEKLVKKYNEEGKAATGPAKKQFRPNEPMKDRGFSSGKGNYKNEQDYQGGSNFYGGNQGGFDNRSGYDSGYGGRDDYGMNRDSFGQRGGYDGGRGGRGGYDSNRGGRGSFDSGRGRGSFDSGRGGRGSFDNGRGGRGGFDSGRGGRGGYDSGRGGRGGYDSGRGGRGGYDSGYGERSDYESNMGSYGGMGGYESSRGGMSSYDSGRGRGSYDNGRGGRGSYDSGRGGRGGFDNNRGGRGGYDSGRGGRSDYDNRGGKSDYDTSSGDTGSYDSGRGGRGGYDSSRGNRGGYESSRGSRGGYDSSRGSRGGYDSSRGSRGGYDNSRGGRGSYDSNRGGRGTDNSRGGRGSYDNNRGSDRGGYDSYSSDTYKKDSYGSYGTSGGQAESGFSGSGSYSSGFKTGQAGRDYGSYSSGTGGSNVSSSTYNYGSTADKSYGNSSSDYNKGSTYSSYQRGGQGSRGGASGYYADESSQSRDTDYSAGQAATKDSQSGYYNKGYGGYGSGSYDDYNKYGSTSDSYTSRTAASSYGSTSQDVKSDVPKYSGSGTQDAAYPAAAPTRTTRWSAEIPKTEAPSVATYTSVTSQSYSQPAATSLPTQQMYGYQQGATATNVASQWAGAAATPAMGQAAYAYPAQSTWSQYGQPTSTQYYSQ